MTYYEINTVLKIELEAEPYFITIIDIIKCRQSCLSAIYYRVQFHEDDSTQIVFAEYLHPTYETNADAKELLDEEY